MMEIVQFRRVSNRADWVDTYELIDDDTGEVITDLSDVTIRFQVRKGCTSYLTAETDDGRVVVSAFGTIEITFPASEMAGLCAGTYEIGFTVERNGSIEQEFYGSVPIVEGVVRT